MGFNFRFLLFASAVVLFVSIGIMMNCGSSPRGYAVFDSCIGVIVASLIPWLVLARRRWFKWQSAKSRGWQIVTAVLLCIALLAAPIAGLCYSVTAKSTDDWGGFSRTLGFFVTVIVFAHVGFAFCFGALLLQIWRDQWCRVLSALVVACYLFQQHPKLPLRFGIFTLRL